MTNRKSQNNDNSLTFMAGEAFGSGFHESTQVALLAMESLKAQDFARILDMGCGSGVLSLVAATWWPNAQITSVDIEEKAVAMTRQNSVDSGFSERITILRSDGFFEKAIVGPFDCIICNMVAEPIIRLAPGIKQNSGGLVILSGILQWLLPQVLDVYHAAGFRVEAEFTMKEWRAVVLERL